MDHLIEILLAIIGSGAIGSIVTHLFSIRKYRAEVEQLHQQVASDKTDNQIKLDEHMKKYLMEITETYRKEAEDRRNELADLQTQNTTLQKQVNDLTVQINQLMGWVVYDMMSYQDWLETELIKIKPDIKLPDYRKPPKFVQQYMESEHGSNNKNGENE